MKMNKKAQMNAMAGVVVAIVLVGVILAIGVKVSNQVYRTIDVNAYGENASSGFDLTTEENDTFSDIKGNTFDAYELSGTGQIVLAAAGILMIVATGLIIFNRR